MPLPVQFLFSAPAFLCILSSTAMQAVSVVINLHITHRILSTTLVRTERAGHRSPVEPRTSIALQHCCGLFIYVLAVRLLHFT
ncbi:hypothetical protein COO60DRAFT_1117068 [Scenedesmus sp. NREL 46B-D3]|nr:hypothetical protein COO60DRAFT_1117068 [Scenedesmus sp. NREL 46B-D3]